MSAPLKVHHDRDGRPRCGRGAQYPVTSDPEDVTCGFCVNILNGVNHGHRKVSRGCGTAAAVRRHTRHREPLDDACREYARRKNEVYRDANRDAINARRRARSRERARQKEVPVLTDPAAAETVARIIARRADAELLADVLGLRLAA